MKTSDEKKFLKLMKDLGISVFKYTVREYMHSEVRPKQDVEYSLNESPDIGFHFKSGRFIGTTSSDRRSFERRRKL